MLTRASRSSYSPDRRVRTSSASMLLASRSSSVSASLSEPASPSSLPSWISTSVSSRRWRRLPTRSTSAWRVDSRPVTRWALVWSSQRSGAATCFSRSAISARIASRSSTCSTLPKVASSCLIRSERSWPATHARLYAELSDAVVALATTASDKSVGVGFPGEEAAGDREHDDGEAEQDRHRHQRRRGSLAPHHHVEHPVVQVAQGQQARRDAEPLRRP